MFGLFFRQGFEPLLKYTPVARASTLELGKREVTLGASQPHAHVVTVLAAAAQLHVPYVVDEHDNAEGVAAVPPGGKRERLARSHSAVEDSQGCAAAVLLSHPDHRLARFGDRPPQARPTKEQRDLAVRLFGKVVFDDDEVFPRAGRRRGRYAHPPDCAPRTGGLLGWSRHSQLAF